MDDGVDAAGGDGDDAQASLDLSDNDDRCPSASCPSRSLPEVRFLQFLVSTNFGSAICLHGVKLFEETKAVEGRTTAPYGWALPYQWTRSSLIASF
jgi:hypothetical protein